MKEAEKEKDKAIKEEKKPILKKNKRKVGEKINF